jgi:hypothetical protein
LLTIVVPLILGIVFASLSAIAYLMTRRTEGLKTLLREAGAHLESLHARNAELEADALAATKIASEHLKTATDLSSNIRHRDELAVQTGIEYQAKLEELETSVGTLLLKLDHYSEQTLSLTSQLKETDLRNQQLVRNQEEHEKLKKITAVLNPEAFNAARRRSTHFETLYKNMRGLKEMAEERNKNWEVAIRKLSGWIITQKRGPVAARSIKNFGPMLNEALDIVGAQLVDDDDFSIPQHSLAGTHVTDTTTSSPA